MNFIKLHRDIVESQAFCHPITFKIWCWLLLKSNFKDSFMSLKTGRGFTEIKVKRGQMIFGRFKAEEQLNIDGSTIYKHLQKLQKWNNIKIETTNQCSIITIINYNNYQDKKTNEHQSNNEKTSK